MNHHKFPLIPGSDRCHGTVEAQMKHDHLSKVWYAHATCTECSGTATGSCATLAMSKFVHLPPVDFNLWEKELKASSRPRRIPIKRADNPVTDENRRRESGENGDQ